MQAPQDFPGAAVIGPSRWRSPDESWRVEHPYHCFSFKSGRFYTPVIIPKGNANGRNLWRRPALVRQLSKEAVMDKEHIKGAADKAKGAMKDAAGKLMDDKGLQAEGKMDKAKGEARQALGDVKDAVRHANDK